MKKCVIVGYGKSGQWAYKLAKRLGYMPIIYDDKFIANPVVEEVDVDFAVVSPGIKMEHSFIVSLINQGVKIISEIEFAYQNRETDSRIIGVTGTNGKTTMVGMLQSVFGENAIIAGNIGTPWSSVVNKNKDTTILELSSFQLLNIEKFKPDIAVLTNLAPDHLDYHGSYKNYINAKLNLIKNANKNTKVVYCGDDIELAKLIANETKFKKFSYSLVRKDEEGLFVNSDNKVVLFKDGKEKSLFDISELDNFSNINKLNALGCILVCLLAEMKIVDILSRLKTFKPYRFRQEKVENKLNCTIINDSKATNLQATLSAIKTLNPNLLLVGGRGKNEEYSDLFEEAIKKQIRKIIAYGESAEEFVLSAKNNGFNNIEKVEDFSSAVNRLLSLSKENDVILFSPACASFDQFSSYEERGSRFNELVEEFGRMHI